jgi:hypothetical protein
MDNITIREGATVYAADGDKIGKVIGYEGSSITVEKGWLFPHDYFVPISAVVRQNGDDLYLNVTKDQALTSDWTNIPAGDGMTFTGASTVDTAGTTGAYDLDRVDTSYQGSGQTATGTIGGDYAAAGMDTAATTQGEV